MHLTLTTQPHRKIRFLDNKILNMFAIVINLQKKNFIFCQNPPKKIFGPQTTNLNKTR